jgi:hypothetical protein
MLCVSDDFICVLFMENTILIHFIFFCLANELRVSSRIAIMRFNKSSFARFKTNPC